MYDKNIIKFVFNGKERFFRYNPELSVIVHEVAQYTEFLEKTEIADAQIYHNLDKEFNTRVVVDLLGYDVVNRHTELRHYIYFKVYRNDVQTVRGLLKQGVYRVIGGIQTKYGDMALVYLGKRRYKPTVFMRTSYRPYIFWLPFNDVHEYILNKIEYDSFYKQFVDDIYRDAINDVVADKRRLSESGLHDKYT